MAHKRRQAEGVGGMLPQARIQGALGQVPSPHRWWRAQRVLKKLDGPSNLEEVPKEAEN